MTKKVRRKLQDIWLRFWMRFAGLSFPGRIATYLAACLAPPYKARLHLAKLYPQGFIAPAAIVHHTALKLGDNVFIGDRVVIYQARNGGAVELSRGVHLYSDIVIETGDGGQLTVGEGTHIQPRCQLSAYKGSIHIGRRVEIAPNCAFYPYNHGVSAGQPVRIQSLTSKGPIVIEDDAWLGVGVIVLDGVHIGQGAVIGAGSVVVQDVPANAIAVGIPARVIKMRDELSSEISKTPVDF